MNFDPANMEHRRILAEQLLRSAAPPDRLRVATTEEPDGLR